MSKTFEFTRIGYTYLPTSDIEGSIRWYTKNLGLQLISKFEDRGSMIAILHYPHKNAIALALIETDVVQPLQIIRNGELYPVMAMNCEDIEYTHDFLKSRGVEVTLIEDLGGSEARYFYFKDDQGNLLEAAWSKWDPEDEIKESFQF